MLQGRRVGRGPAPGSASVLALDLDRFKHVNDAMGHAAGDELLRQVAERLRAVVRGSDVPARLGGDEYTVLMTDLGSESDASALAERIVTAVGAPYPLPQAAAVIGVSIGIALARPQGDEPDALLRLADHALYEAKHAGRGIWRFSHGATIPLAA